MHYVNKDGKIYTPGQHVLDRMRERKIPFEWIEETILNPDDTREEFPNRRAYNKIIGQTSVRVVTNEEEQIIITVHTVREDV